MQKYDFSPKVEREQPSFSMSQPFHPRQRLGVGQLRRQLTDSVKKRKLAPLRCKPSIVYARWRLFLVECGFTAKGGIIIFAHAASELQGARHGLGTEVDVEVNHFVSDAD